MSPTIKKIFINPELEYLRSGWRIGIFFFLFSVCGFVIAVPGSHLAKEYIPLPFPGIQALLVYTALTLATWIMLRFVDKRPFASIGLTLGKSAGRELAQGLLLGSGMMTLIFVFEYATGMVSVEFRDLEFQQQLFIFGNSALLYIVVGYGEELMFRGYILQITAEGTSRLVSAVSFALLFAVAHKNNPNASLFGLINVALAGIWLALAYYKTNGLWLPIGMHISWNFFQGFVYGFPVSGTTSEQEQISKAIQSGSDWITGGTFGPEGGVLATILLFASTIFIYFSPWIRSSPDAWKYSDWKETRKTLLEFRQSGVETAEQNQ